MGIQERPNGVTAPTKAVYFNEGAGSVATEYGGVDEFQFSNQAEWAADMFGLYGVSTSSLPYEKLTLASEGDPANYINAGIISYSCWVYVTKVSDGSGPYVIANMYLDGVGEALDLRINFSGGVKFNMPTMGAATTGTAIFANPANIGRWVHIAALYNGTNQQIWVDGANEYDSAKSAPTISENISNSAFAFCNETGAVTQNFEGIIDAFQYWNGHALTPSEIDILANGSITSNTVDSTTPTAQDLGLYQETLGSNVIHTSSDAHSYDFYVKTTAAGREGYSKAGQNVKIVDVFYDNSGGTGTKYVSSNIPTNTILRLNGEDYTKSYIVTAGTETILTDAYIRLSDTTMREESLGKARVVEVQDYTSALNLTWPLTLPIIIP